jgi:hypothetical protein
MGGKAYGDLEEVDQLAFVKCQLAGAIPKKKRSRRDMWIDGFFTN